MLRKLLVLAVLSVVVCTSASAQEAVGVWVGTLKTPARDLQVAVHIREDAQGQYQASMNSLDQGAFDIPVALVSANSGSLVLDIPDLGTRYEAKWDPSTSQWIGIFNQHGTAMPLNLSPDRAAASADADLDGDWSGILDLGAMKLTNVFHIRSVAGRTVASMDVIEQRAKGVSASVRRNGDRLTLDVQVVHGSFDGTVDADKKTLRGRWTQSGASLPLTLTRRLAGAPVTELRRPQNPVKPYPYQDEQVSYDNPVAGVRLAATITLPKGDGPFPAALLIAGSGPNDRDETIMGHRPFLVLADHLTRQGIAALRVDKRGVGQSTGDYSKATTADFASDVEAGLSYLKTRRDIDPKKIGLIGHSEGALIAPAVASEDRSVAWLVMMASSGITGEEILYLQERLIPQAMGASPQQIEDNVAWNRRVFAILKSETNPQTARELIKVLAKDQGMSEAQAKAKAQEATAGFDWLRYYLTYSPVPALEKLRCPVLVINGDKDLQIPPKENLPAIRRALANNPDATIVELPRLNHLFQPAKLGTPTEYGQIEQTISPIALDTISSWILKHTK